MAFLFSNIFSAADKAKLVAAITQAELHTSGEIRLYMEANCPSEALDRAMEVFAELKMEQTELRNGILIYVAFKSKKVAIYGDTAIHRRLGNEFWNVCIARLIQDFKGKKYTSWLVHLIAELGVKLGHYLPIAATDQNELPNDIVFGQDMLE